VDWLLMLQVRVPKEETGMVSDLRYGWKKLRKQGIEVSNQLAEMQVIAGCCSGLIPAAAADKAVATHRCFAAHTAPRVTRD
jgi:hypothetical protein